MEKQALQQQQPKIEFYLHPPCFVICTEIMGSCIDVFKRKDGTDLPEHIHAVYDILRQTMGVDVAERLYPSAIIHDFGDVLFNGNPRDIDRDILIQQFRNYKGDPEIEFALGIVKSAEEFEKAAESWRTKLYGEINGDQEVIPEEFQQLGFESAEAFNSAFNEELLFKKASEREEYVFDQRLMGYRAPMDQDTIQTMVETLSTWDVEGLMIKTAEVIDNIRRPKPGDPVAAWRDAQELLSFYGPLCEQAGFDKLAMEAYSEALWYLNGNPIGSENEGELTDIQRRVLELQQKAEQFIGIDGLKGIQKFSNLNEEIIFSSRVKSKGSLAEKLRLGKAQSDLVGVRLIMLNDDLGFDSLTSLIIQVIGSFEGIDLGDVNPNGEAIRINLKGYENGNLQELLRALGLNNILVVVEGERPSGYSAVHINMRSINGEFGIEVQIVTQEGWGNNNLGASHILYKAGIGNQEKGQIIDSLESIQDRGRQAIENLDETILTESSRSAVESLFSRDSSIEP